MTLLVAGTALSPASAAPTAALPANRLATYVEARTAAALGEDLRSARLLAGLAALEPADTALARRAASAAISSGDLALGLRLARAQSPQSLGLDARLLLVADALRRKQSNEALALIDSRTDAEGGFLAPLLRAWAAAERGKDGAALLLASDAANSLLAPSLGEQRAHLLFAQGRAAEAKSLLGEVLGDAGGRSTRLRLAFAESLRKAGDRSGAAALLAEDEPRLRHYASDKAAPGIAIDSPAKGLSSMLLGLAAALAQSNDRALPLSLVQVAKHAAPESSEPPLLLALLLERDKKPAAALAALSSIRDDDPFIGDARDIAARTLIDLGRKDEALARARAAVQARNATADDWARLGNVLDEVGEHAAAANAYATGGAIARSNSLANAWTFSLLRADQLESAGRWPDARAELERALATNPDEPLLLNFLGYGALVRGEQPAAAEAMIRKAVALRPDDASITDSLGWALFKRGRTDEAIAALRKAAAGDPKQPEIHEHLGDALYATGRHLEGRFAWRAALVNAEDKDRARLEAKVAAGLTPANAAP